MMRLRLAISICCYLLSFNEAFSQVDFPRDTSYSIRSAYLKIKKKHPDVSPIEPHQYENVKEHYDVPYVNVGRELSMDVFVLQQKDEKLRPAVMLIFGGGWSSGEKANQVPMAQKLAAAGYVAMVPEYRLSPEIPYPAAVHDLKAAIRWMRAKALTYQIDTNKIAVLGCSAGAQLASLLGTTGDMPEMEGEEGLLYHSSKVQAIVNIDGIVSFVHPEASAEGEAAARWLGGTRAEAPDNWRAASPLEYVSRETPPVLFVNSAQPRFHAGRDDMIKILNEYSIYNEVHTLEDSPHSFWLVNPWFEPTYQYTIDFLNKVLK